MSNTTLGVPRHGDSRGYEKQIEALKKENRKLHDIIQANMKIDDSSSEVGSRFGTLKFEIQQVASRHFGEFHDHLGDDEFRDMRDNSRCAYLMAMIARGLFEDLFIDKLFGLDGHMEKCLGEIERRLLERQGTFDV